MRWFKKKSEKSAPAPATRVAYDFSQAVDASQEPSHHVVFQNEFVRAFIVQVTRRSRTLSYRHSHDYFFYVGIGGEIIKGLPGEEPRHLRYRDGECELGRAGVALLLENTGDMPFRGIAVELPPKVSELQREENPWLTKYMGRGLPPALVNVLCPLMKESRGAVFDVDVNRTVQVNVRGPAIVASPSGDPVEFPKSQHNPALSPIRLHQANLMWVPPGETATSAGEGRVVIFQVGIADDDFAAVPKPHRPLKKLEAHAEEPD